MRLHEVKQPVLVGTTSIEKSELLSDILKRQGVRHVVLNAKFHEKEAEIVAQAGRLGMVTIATNMAGRGTDILLGGNSEFMARQDLVKKSQARAVSAAEGAISPTAGPGMVRFYYASQEFETTKEAWDAAIASHLETAQVEHESVVAAGGLHILGTERHESRRVDNQLRGRAGRQGDPGSSRFFLSLEDDLMRIFAREWVSTLLQRLGMEEGVPIESRMISNRIEAAQKAVETQNFESRKHVLEYDDVMNKQREAVYGLRRQLMEGVDQKQLVADDYVSTILSNILEEHAPEKSHPGQWNLNAIFTQLFDVFGVKLDQRPRRHRHRPAQPPRTRRDHLRKGSASATTSRKKSSARPPCATTSASSCSPSSTAYGKTTSSPWTTSRRASACADTPSRTPSSPTSESPSRCSSSMMIQFQQDTARHLFRMQIIGPDGKPIETVQQMQAAQLQRAGASAQTSLPLPQPGEEHAPVPIHTRAPSTTIDELEKEFQRKKRRELEQARAVSSASGESSAPAQRVTGEKVGRNDPCPCGSGKKYKKCHGATA